MHYRDWAQKLQPSMRQVHLASEKLFAYYAGQTIPIVDHRTGKIIAAPFFVATLGALLQSIKKALQFIGGVTAMIVSENPRWWFRSSIDSVHRRNQPTRRKDLPPWHLRLYGSNNGRWVGGCYHNLPSTITYRHPVSKRHQWSLG